MITNQAYDCKSGLGSWGVFGQLYSLYYRLCMTLVNGGPKGVRPTTRAGARQNLRLIFKCLFSFLNIFPNIMPYTNVTMPIVKSIIYSIFSAIQGSVSSPKVFSKTPL